jgi:hypothetical protein
MSALRTGFCALFVILLLAGSATAREEDWEDSGRTSKDGNFGVGGWFEGRNCPGIELFWRFKKDSESPTAFFRLKNGKIIILGRGMAMFSPDCKYFWFAGYDGDAITVFETASGQWISSLSGCYPAWSPDSKKIYMSKVGKNYQLWSWSILKREKRLIYEVADFCWCNPPGEGVNWYPVKFDANGNLKWTYPLCDKARNQVPRAGKILTIDPATRKVKNTESVDVDCE